MWLSVTVVFLVFPKTILCFLINIKVNKDETKNPKSDIYLDSFHLIQKYNYSVEIHNIVTADGYVLETFRIPGKGPPVLLVHGIGDSSDSWLVLGPQKSLGFLLANAGYDVWLYNARGNRYCKKHIKKLSSKVFWDFSFEEMGTQDLPATIDYILNKTSVQKLTYIGYSQGTTTFFILCSIKPEYNDKIDQAILLAPVAWLTFTKYPFIRFFSDIRNGLISFSENKEVYEVFPFNVKSNFYHAKVCNTTAPYSFLCHVELYLNFGLRNLNDLSPERLPIITSHIPAGASAKTFFHFIQLYASKRFQRFDYGLQGNQEKYSTSTPPEYDVSLVRVPSTLFVSEIDWFSDMQDVKVLLGRLNNLKHFIAFNKSLEFTHLEFVYGTKVNELINIPVMNILKTF